MNDTSKIKNFFEYLPECIKFYKLKNEGLVKAIFLMILIFQIAGNFIQYKLLDLISLDDIELLSSFLTTGLVNADIEELYPSEQAIYIFVAILITLLLVKLISNLLLSVYMYSYICEIKGRTLKAIDSLKGAFKHIGRLIAYNIIFGLMVAIGTMFFFIPGIIAYIIFVFGYCYILDIKLTVPDAITACSEITKGKKPQILSVFAGFFLVFELPMILIFSGTSFGTACLASFFSTIVSLILQRLIVQLYMDLEYKEERKNNKFSQI
ncbi:hypothetical protein EHE19_008070 [Ruminiclostridium herbifermentans]|uniref:Glycerophosphoryl diester phosphodiesterase membrane domain-containing protein n=1 Tax=Ruminiclostridium herbifermentans TaxID=2488810 RepID=A0A4U7JNJ0_9FIRM|nr:hypothetical protein [Ruminiclostridium herbifermentans]QNU68350.1 hypothetical protein EHE19_008070 [Ruminiclostridium herbifermentans]